ncbi:MAG: hypothetical protein JSR45_13940 [Proteobacteria bacterium]|nr:hypothetical protein [Pseudomonadota bacterium]
MTEVTNEGVELDRLTRLPPLTRPAPWTEEPTGPNIGLLLRVSAASGESNGHAQWHGTMPSDLPDPCMKWPESGYVQAEWGGPWWGIYGLLEGVGDWGSLPRHPAAIWQVVAVDVRECKKSPITKAYRAPRGWVIYSGDAVGALKIMMPRMVRSGRLHEALCDTVVEPGADDLWAKYGAGASVTNEDRHGVAASLGMGGIAYTTGAARYAVAMAGDSVARGWWGMAVSLRGGHAKAPANYGDAISRRSAGRDVDNAPVAAEAGNFGVAVALGPGGMAKAGIGGAIVLGDYVEENDGRARLRGLFSTMVGENGFLPGVWYTLVDGFPSACVGPRDDLTLLPRQAG